jgi:ADP-heptose:LPS heptosyltransferase
MTGPHVLVARQDSVGDVLLAGPAVRAVAASAGRVTMLCGPRGAEAAALLPGVDEVLCWHTPWIDAEPRPVRRRDIDDLVDRLARHRIDQAIVLTSLHQSPLPTALLLRMAGVRTIAGISTDYPGSLLDVRQRVDEASNPHEVERALDLVGTLGYRLPPGDDARLSIHPLNHGSPEPPHLEPPYVVVHPGASVPARAWPPRRHAEVVAALVTRGWRVAVTGSSDEQALTALVAGPPGAGGPGGLNSEALAQAPRPQALPSVSPPVGEVTDLGGQLSLAGLAGVLAGAEVVVAGNTGPAHLAAAVGTPVVSLFAPTVPADRWRPWGVPVALLGRQDAPCAGSRARRCPVPGHPCLDSITTDEVLAAVDALASRSLAVEASAR